jgi:hypothetical protein
VRKTGTLEERVAPWKLDDRGFAMSHPPYRAVYAAAPNECVIINDFQPFSYFFLAMSST